MKVEKLCNFYASKYHLSMIILEYLKEKSVKKSKVITFLQEELEDEINALTEKYNYDINSINDINFKITKDIYGKDFEQTKNMVFIVQGDLEYIKEANEYIYNSLEKGTNIKIVNCYNFSKQKQCMKEIIEKSDKILFTTGEKVID